MLQQLQDLFNTIVQGLWSAYLLWCMKILYWVLDFLLDTFVDVWDVIILEAENCASALFSAVPQIKCGFGAASHWIGVANGWLPIRESVTMLLAYWTFVAAFCCVKFIWKGIPTTG